jgi:hypothetical protein
MGSSEDHGRSSRRSGAGSGRDTRLTVLIGLAAFAYYLLILGGHQYSIDGIAMFQSAKALVFRHSWRFDPPLLWGRVPIDVSGWPLGMTFAYVPLLVVLYPVFVWFPGLQAMPYDASLPQNPALYSNAAYLLCSVLNPLLTAGTACLVFHAGRLLGLRRELAVLAALVYGFGSPAAAYARYDYTQPLAALTLTATVWGVLRADRTGSRRPLVWAGIALGYGLLTRIEFVVLAAWIIGWVYLRSRRRSAQEPWLHAGILAGGMALAIVVHVLINWVKFGDPTAFRGGRRIAALFPGSPSGFAQGLAGLLVSPAHGLLFFFPLAWLALPGLRTLARHRTAAGSLFGGVIAISLVLYASFHFWWGGWCWGPRYLLPILPLVTLAAAAWLSSATGTTLAARRAVFLLLAALGLVVSWNGILTDFIFHLGWIQQSLGLPDTWATQFRPVASPLITGWLPQSGRPIDIFWVKLASGRLPMPGARWIGALIPMILLAGIVWAGRRIVQELRAGDRL